MERRPAVAVGAVAMQDGAILLIRRGQPPAEGRWSLPGGRVEWGESLGDATAARWTRPAEMAELPLSDGLLEALEEFGIAFG